MGYTFTFIFHPAVKTLAAAYENPEMTRVVPENNIMGPKPLANEPSIWRAPDIGVPVNPAMEDEPESNVSSDHQSVNLEPNFSMGLIFATQAMNTLIYPPLKKPISMVTDIIAA